MTCERLARTVLPVFVALFALTAPLSAQAKGGRAVEAGAAVLDGTYHVGSSAGQYASDKSSGYGDVDPHVQQVKNQASYGVQSRESVRALVVKGTDDHYVALVSDDHYIPQDALWRRTAQILDAKTGGVINETNLTMTITHNHSSPSYSSFDWGVWTFQDAFDFRFFDYYANQNASAVLQAYHNLKPVRVSATVVRYDAVQKNPMGPGWADDGTPDGFPRPHTDHDLSVVHFEGLRRHDSVATLFNWGQHPEDLEGYDLISGEFPAEAERFIDRTLGGVSIFTQNATGTSEVEEDRWHPVHDRELVDHAQYNQMEWAARQLATAVIGAVRDIRAQRPNPDDRPTPYGGTSYHDRFIPWMSRFPVAMEDRWFPGPVSHPYPGVSSCRTDPALQGNPRLPVVGLPDCQDVPAGDSLSPVISQTGVGFPGLSTDTFESLGVPIPENYSFPSTGALEDTLGVHMQAFRLGDILFTVCSCEQWVEQSYNIKTRTDTKPHNEWLGYDPTSPDADPTEKCTRKDAKSWTCTIWDYPKVGSPDVRTLPDDKIQHMRAEILNDAKGWDDPNCKELGCGYQAESEPTDLKKIRGNFTHDDTVANAKHGYRLTVTIGMANDYNGYIASYREFMDHDHYRKALTGWGPHSSDYYATRLTQMGRALNGDRTAQTDVDQQTEPSKASAAWAPFVAKEVADQNTEEAKVKAVGEAASAGVKAYALTLPDDGGQDQALTQPKDIERFDAATFSWDGGNNYTDNPQVTVERQDATGNWVPFADQSGEVPVTLKYPQSSEGTFDPAAIAEGVVGYHAQPQEWRWTATFEAFVSRFALVDPQGHEYSATPTGTYRFVVNGLWRKGNADVAYTRISNQFQVKPWSGITVDGAGTDSSGHVVFSAGPTHQIAERTARNTSRPPFNAGNAPYTFSIGPVDFPDTAKDQKATGARFLNNVRGYSGTSPSEVEHYCLDCSFRPWLDATDRVVAAVTIGGKTEIVHPDGDGHFRTNAVLAPGQTATITIQDAWGDTSAPATVTG
jgi:Neutral/alkaline non-lysosomal ceramidase, N-terminal